MLAGINELRRWSGSPARIPGSMERLRASVRAGVTRRVGWHGQTRLPVAFARVAQTRVRPCGLTHATPQLAHILPLPLRLAADARPAYGCFVFYSFCFTPSFASPFAPFAVTSPLLPPKVCQISKPTHRAWHTRT